MEIEEETIYNVGNLFDLNYLEKCGKLSEKKIEISLSLSKMVKEPFNQYFFLNNILTDEPYDKRAHLNISKFKENNIKKVKEDMLYYCTPVDILNKLDGQNSEYRTIESQNEFVEDLRTLSFLQNEKIIKEDLDAKERVEKIKKNKNLKDCKKKLENESKNYDENIINKCNKIIILLQNDMKKFSSKNIKIEEILENINKIILETKNIEITLEKIGYKMLMILENNLLFLFGLIDKFYGKDIDDICKFLEKYIELFNIIKSNRLFFAIAQYLNKNKNISEKINFDKPFELFSKNCINISEIIKLIKEGKIHENNLMLPNSLIDTSLSSEKEKDISKNMKNDYYSVNNSEELIIFKIDKMKPKIKLMFYRINLRNKENEVLVDNSNIISVKDELYKLLDFGEIFSDTNEGENIIDINISIKNDLIYVCYIINQKLKDSGNESKFELIYKIFTTSMTLLKEDKIKLNNLDYQNALLCSDKNNLYIINENKIFVMKKEYSMNSFQKYEFLKKGENKDISITDYKYYNCFNLENLLILENKKDINDLILVQINHENNKYIFNLFPMKQSIPKDEYKYILSYNENDFTFIKINNEMIYFSFNDCTEKCFLEMGCQFIPFESCLIKNAYEQNSKDNLYKILIKNYTYFVNLYGNFDNIESVNIGITNFPFSLSFNINTNNLNFIIDQLINCKDMEMNYYYIILLKQFICSIYNADLFKNENLTKVIEYLKNFTLNIKTNKDNKYRIKILKEIINISSNFDNSNIIEIEDVEKLLFIKDAQKDLKINLLLLDLLLTQPGTQQNTKIFKLIYEYEKKLFSYIYRDKIPPEEENKIISSLFKLYKNVMSKAMVIINNYYLKNDDYLTIKEEEGKAFGASLFTYMKPISDNINYISNLYKNISETKIGKMPFLFNSLSFSFFFLIIHRGLNKSFEKDFEIFSSFYNALITLDKLNINQNWKKAVDLNNLIEITNSKKESEVKDTEKTNNSLF